MLDTLDTQLSLNDLRKYVPSSVTKDAIWRWVRKGLKTRRGVTVKLRATFDGNRAQLYTTLGDFWQFRLQLDPCAIIALGTGQYMAYCARCEKYKIFKRDEETNARTTLANELKWQLTEAGWRCQRCKG